MKLLDYQSLIQNDNHIYQREDLKKILTYTTDVIASSRNPFLPIAPYITFQKLSDITPPNNPLATEDIGELSN